MGRETILRDLDPLRKPRGHHPPSDSALQRAESEDPPQPPLQLAANNAAPQKPEKRQQIGCADHPPQEPMAPLPPENRLELVERHAGVHLAVLRNRLVSIEGLHPCCSTERRQATCDRLPPHDR